MRLDPMRALTVTSDVETLNVSDTSAAVAGRPRRVGNSAGSKAQRFSRQARGMCDEPEPRDDDRVGAETVDGAEDAAILDVGCGGGPTIGALAALAPEGKVFIWAGLFGSKRGRGTRVECSCDRRRAS